MRGQPEKHAPGFIAPGDVLFVGITTDGIVGGLARVGRAGGMWGHVVVVTSVPERVAKHGTFAARLQDIWPANVHELWMVKTAESCRDHDGLHEAYSLIYVEPGSNRFILLGELDEAMCEFTLNNEALEVWQSPAMMRRTMKANLVLDVLAEMREQTDNWSFLTAAKAVIMGSACSNQLGLSEIEDCWHTPPICTSIAIVFWQRYLCKFGQLMSQDPCSLILQFMPLKADRALPSEVLRSMESTGWTRRRVFTPMAAL
mmetsp:Transcript_41422/g.95257  ORF Transcript_41422/g.95257 Transcript_41422/m.95257 type:complete len:258 (+) Transcript_41422:87-860(+)